jgi:hypothetical protein
VRILIVVHGFPPLSSGGTESTPTSRPAASPRRRRVHVFTREANPARAERRQGRRRDGVWIRWVNRTFRDTRRFAESCDNPGVAACLAQWLDREPCDVAHIHHLTPLDGNRSRAEVTPGASRADTSRLLDAVPSRPAARPASSPLRGSVQLP